MRANNEYIGFLPNCIHVKGAVKVISFNLTFIDWFDRNIMVTFKLIEFSMVNNTIQMVNN